tara:strand:- start:4666 stop:5364 length:699 start_codon:yes stop_codon:yes gene_type:complete
MDGINKNQKLEVGLRLNMGPITTIQLNTLYDAFASAETGHLVKQGKDTYVRTSASKTEGGSDAFGPVQVMSKLYGKNAPVFADTGKSMINYSLDEIKLQSKLINQTDMFYLYGNEPKKPGYDVRFDYSDKGKDSGIGFGFSDDEKKAYESSAKKLITWQFTNLAKNDPHAMMNIWRYGDARGEKHTDDKGNVSYKDISKADPRYYEVMINKLGDVFKPKPIESSIIDTLKKI